MLQVIQRRWWWLSLSGLAMLASAVSIGLWGFRPAIDFTGGSLLEVRYATERPGVAQVQESLQPLAIGGLSVEPVGERSLLLRGQTISEERHQQILGNLRGDAPASVEEIRFESIGPVIGQELARRAYYALILVVVFILLYIAWAFRKVSKPVPSWVYGLAAVIALFHDVLITSGVFSALGRFAEVEVDALFITALLTIMGFSVHDTIVVFDRTRENLFRHKGLGDFETTVNHSVNETIIRSINTSLTVELVLAAMYLFGGVTIRHFALALMVGIFVGTYSSIFVASPLLVVWQRWRSR